MKRVVCAGFVFLCIAALPAPGIATDRKAEDIVEKMREAIGGETRIAALKGLTAEGTFRRMAGEREMSGKLELKFAPPDKILRREEMELPNGMEGPALVTALNGIDGWRNVEQAPAAHGAMMFVRRAPGAGADIEQSTVRSELTRILLVVLGQSPSGVPVTFTYAGAAEAPDGNAEALDVKGDNIDARLYVDSKTYLPVMLAYKGVEPRIRTASVPRAQAERRDAADLERRMRDAQLNEPPPPMVDMQLFVGEHKNVDGLVLPHRLTVSIGERTSEEWEITSYKTNAALDPAIFVKPPKAS